MVQTRAQRELLPEYVRAPLVELSENNPAGADDSNQMGAVQIQGDGDPGAAHALVQQHPAGAAGQHGVEAAAAVVALPDGHHPVDRFGSYASVLSSGLQYTLGLMYTVFYLDHHVSQQLIQHLTWVLQHPTWVFVALFAVHQLVTCIKLYILYLVIMLFIARIDSTAELPQG
mmetsp:Transcript_11427/g.23246  ORF Transcript_11427/g.23246 Transcript_11427/m.23246 type:complete len:172 (+) Transcript_11427:34-549(+)